VGILIGALVLVVVNFAQRLITKNKLGA